jgi:oligopeptide/dipeptide ABC transporter ATP-binding protein
VSALDVEISPAEELQQRPVHPYTEALLSAVPIPDPDLSASRRQIVLDGDVPSPISPPSECRFHPRCRYATEVCTTEEPPLAQHGSSGHLAACHHPLSTGFAQVPAQTRAEQVQAWGPQQASTPQMRRPQVRAQRPDHAAVQTRDPAAPRQAVIGICERAFVASGHRAKQQGVARVARTAVHTPVCRRQRAVRFATKQDFSPTLRFLGAVSMYRFVRKPAMMAA